MRRFAIRSRRGAYFALVVLTLIWGFNWVALKLAMQHADPVVFNVQRTLVAIVVLLALMLWRGTSLAPNSFHSFSCRSSAIRRPSTGARFM